MAGLFDLITTGLRRRAEREEYVTHAMLMDTQRRMDDSYAPQRSRKEILADYDPDQKRAHRPDMSVVPTNAVRTHGWASGDDRYRLNHKTIDAIDERHDDLRRSKEAWLQRLSEPVPPPRPAEPTASRDDTNQTAAGAPTKDQVNQAPIWTETPEYAERMRHVREQNERVQRELDRQHDLRRELIEQARAIHERDTQAAALQERMHVRAREEAAFYASQSAPALNQPQPETAAKESAPDRSTGELIAHGDAPYRFDAKGGTPSYFVTIKDDGGRESTQWGKDLARAVDDSGAQVGDRIHLARTGQDAAVQVRDADGQVQPATRRGWNVERLDAPTDRQSASVAPATNMRADETTAAVRHPTSSGDGTLGARDATPPQEAESLREPIAQTTTAPTTTQTDTAARVPAHEDPEMVFQDEAVPSRHLSEEDLVPLSIAGAEYQDAEAVLVETPSPTHIPAAAVERTRPPVHEDPDLIFDEEAVPAHQLSEADLFPLTLSGDEYERAAQLDIEPAHHTWAEHSDEQSASSKIAPVGADRLSAWRERSGDDAQSEGGNSQGQGNHPAALTLELESKAAQTQEPDPKQTAAAPTPEPVLMNHDDDDMGYSFSQSSTKSVVPTPQVKPVALKDSMGATQKPSTQPTQAPASQGPARAVPSPPRRTMKR